MPGSRRRYWVAPHMPTIQATTDGARVRKDGTMARDGYSQTEGRFGTHGSPRQEERVEFG